MDETTNDANVPIYNDMGSDTVADTTKEAATEETRTTDAAPAEETPTADAAVEVKPVTETTDDKSVDAKPDETKADEGKPAEYVDFKLPEGQSMDQEALDKFIPFAKESGLSQEGAQGVIDIASDMMTRAGQQQEQAFEEQLVTWKQEIVSDPEIGGVKQVAAVAAGERALGRFGTPEFMDMLDKTQFKDHPEMRRFLTRVGQAVSEDVTVTGDPAKKSSGISGIYDKSDHK